MEDPYDRFPAGFFSRADESNDQLFYDPLRLVTHIDDRAIRAVGTLYEQLDIGAPKRNGPGGRVLDLMSSWVSHFIQPPTHLTVLGMNERELAANPDAVQRVVHDLNANPVLPFDDHSFDDAVCCVSIDYLATPIEVMRELQRVLQPGGRFVCTFSNRCFPTKAIRGWLSLNDDQRCQLVAEYFALAGGFEPAEMALCTAPGSHGDPLYAVWAATQADRDR